MTGATGKTGAAVVEKLLAKGYPVRASVRVRDARSEAMAQRGAKVVVADLFDPDQDMVAIAAKVVGHRVRLLNRPFWRCSSWAFVRPWTPWRKHEGISRDRSHASLNHWVAERVFDWSGLGVTHLRPGFFAEWPAKRPS